MTLTFLDLYNSAASQEWSMYDNDVTKTDEFEKSLIIDLNKAITEIMYSYPFSFRERTHIMFTMPKVKSYPIPKGLILKDKEESYCVKINSQPLKLIRNYLFLDQKQGIPESFYLKGSNIIFYPIPSEKFIVTIEYLTLAIGENSSEEPVFYLQSKDDTINVPEHLEEIFKQAVISRTMLNSIASEKDENYSAYKKQSETAYRLLVKYSKGVGQEKFIKI